MVLHFNSNGHVSMIPVSRPVLVDSTPSSPPAGIKVNKEKSK